MQRRNDSKRGGQFILRLVNQRLGKVTPRKKHFGTESPLKWIDLPADFGALSEQLKAAGRRNFPLGRNAPAWSHHSDWSRIENGLFLTAVCNQDEDA